MVSLTKYSYWPSTRTTYERQHGSVSPFSNVWLCSVTLWSEYRPVLFDSSVGSLITQVRVAGGAVADGSQTLIDDAHCRAPRRRSVSALARPIAHDNHESATLSI